MNFDDAYMLKLAIRVSDYDRVNKHIKGVKNVNPCDLYNFLSLYNKDLRIFKLISSKCKVANMNQYLLNMLGNPFDNKETVLDVMKGIKDLNYFVNDKESVVTSLCKTSIEIKKMDLLEYLLKHDTYNFNAKNKIGESNSQIISDKDTVNVDSLFVEKIENLLKYSNENNKHLFFEDKTFPLEKQIKNFINEPNDSLDIKLADIEYKLLKLNITLRKMYEVNNLSLSENLTVDMNKLNKIHTSVIESFLFETLLEKI